MNAFSSSSDLIIDCDEMLLGEVRMDNLDDVQRVLQDPNINLNYDIGDGGTVLFESLFTKNIDIFEELVKAGFDIHFRNDMQETPLHTAVMHSTSEIIQSLIQKGADIDARDCYGHTPLGHAAFHENIDALCMLLYYDADVNAVCNDNMTPFMWALENDQVNAANILYNFYDDFSCKSKNGTTALDLATRNSNPLTIDIFEKSTIESECLESVLISSLDYKNATLFKLIWSVHKEDIFAQLNQICQNLFFSICNTSQFSNRDWLDCLYLLFTVPITFAEVYNVHKKPILINLIFWLYKRKITLHNRMVLINLCTSSGLNVKADGINMAYSLYGFNEEMETFIHLYQQNIVQNYFLPLPRLIFTLEDNYQIETITPIFEFLEKYNINLDDIDTQEIIIKSLGFTSLSFPEKQTISNRWMEHFNNYERIDVKLDAIPEVPSLLELSRNQLRQFIKQRCGVVRAYQFYNVLNKLNLPQCLKDVVCFKTALY